MAVSPRAELTAQGSSQRATTQGSASRKPGPPLPFPSPLLSPPVTGKQQRASQGQQLRPDCRNTPEGNMNINNGNVSVFPLVPGKHFTFVLDGLLLRQEKPLLLRSLNETALHARGGNPCTRVGQGAAHLGPLYC